MKSPMVIPWIEDTERIIFSCHTSIITDEIIKSHIKYPPSKNSQDKSLLDGRVDDEDPSFNKN